MKFVAYAMGITITLIVLTFFSHIWATGYSTQMYSPSHQLNGKHLRVIWARWSGNPKGLRGPLKGGFIIDCLAHRFNFTYEMVRVTEHKLEPSENGKGLFSYLLNQQCDLLLQDVIPTQEHQQIVDITVPWVFTSASLLMHVPDESVNIYAVVKPFQWPIWVGLVISISCVIFILYLLQRYFQENQLKTSSYSLTRPNRVKTLQTKAQGDGSHLACTATLGKHFIYVLSNLLLQAGPCPSNRLPFRIVAGAWSLAAFIFVQAYTSTLSTYVLTPINNPLVNSPYEIPERKDVQLLVRKGGATDYYLSDINSTNKAFRKLGERLNSSPQSRCNLSECIRLLTPGSKYVYLDGLHYHMDIILENFKKTGKCNLQLGKESLVNVMGSFALPKNSKYTKTVNQGLLEIIEAGLVDYWDVMLRPMPLQCLKNIGKGSNMLKLKSKKPPALTLKNLTGAFVILLLGFSLSLLAFLCEKIVSMPSRNRRRLEQAQMKFVNKSANTFQEKSAAIKIKGETLSTPAPMKQ